MRFVQNGIMSQQKIVITGGPSTGKTSILEELQNQGAICYPEVSRNIIREAQEQNIAQPYLEDPIQFSKLILEKRIEQFKTVNSDQDQPVYYDRGIVDTYAYLLNSKIAIPSYFEKACIAHPYQTAFILPPWQKIYTIDNERYESFEQAKEIHRALVAAYQNFGYHPISVPIGTISERTAFIRNQTAAL